MKNKFIVVFALILAATLVISIVINYEEIIQSVFNQNYNHRHTVIVDAGHGGLTNTID